MTNADQQINSTEREKYFADHFRSIKKNGRNIEEEKISLPSVRDSRWRRFKKFRKSEHEDIEAIADMVAGDDINSKIGYNIAKTTASANIQPDGGETKAQSKSSGMASSAAGAAGGLSIGGIVMDLLGQKGNSITNIVIREFINYTFIPACIMIFQAILYALPFFLIVILMLTAWEQIFGWIDGIADTLTGE